MSLLTSSPSLFLAPIKRQLLPPFAASSKSNFSSNNVNLQWCWSSFLENKRSSLRVCCSQITFEDDMIDEACELVNGAEVLIGEGSDSVDAYLFQAVKNNNGTGILLLPDIFGFEDSATRDFAYRVACNGYNVLLPDLFRGDPWSKDRPMPQFDEWHTRQNTQRVAKDIFTSARWMVDELEAAGITKKLGIIGFCFGGGHVVNTLAQDEAAYFSNGISFYGTRIDSSVATNIKVPILFMAGDNDPLCPVNVLREMEKKVNGSKVVIFTERGHGFAHRPQSPEEDADAEEAFKIMRNWLL